MWVRGIVLHTTHGKYPQTIHPGVGNAGGALANIKYWNRVPAYASSHLLVDADGRVIQTSDLITEQTWHATSVNAVTVGIEIVQGSDGSLFQGQIDTVVHLCDWLTARLGIQRQIPMAYAGKPIDRLVHGGLDVVGVVGHRDQTTNRGRGDPGDLVMDALVAASYERFDMQLGMDLAAWKDRQKFLGFPLASRDGVAGPRVVNALKAKGFVDGIWVRRP